MFSRGCQSGIRVVLVLHSGNPVSRATKCSKQEQGELLISVADKNPVETLCLWAASVRYGWTYLILLC